ncbi:MAG: hypothetical protein IPO81_08745 [Kouleothrix sp.]|nr:hypothetical protein [Kouleothrix sp.]
MPFADTSNKATIRRLWDLPILERWHDRYSKSLSYFGLTGPEIKDLLDWRHIIDKKTAVESPGNTRALRLEADETIGRMRTNMMMYGLSSGFQIMRADIEDVIINAIDIDGQPPQINNGGAAHVAKFMYDIVNLDFDGGLAYTSKGKAAKRIVAIKKLFERQSGHDFVLFLTINVRDTLRSELDEYIRELQGRDRGEGWHDLLEWYLRRGKGEREYKLKVLVPTFIHAVAELHMFRSTCYPPIVYDGHNNARMLHFTFELQAQLGRNLRSFSKQDDRDLVLLPMFRCRDSTFTLAPGPNSETQLQQVPNLLDFLPENTRTAIINGSV